MASGKRLQPKEISILRSTLKMSDAEFSERIGLADRRMVKLLESGGMKPSDSVNKKMLRLLQQSAPRSPRLKKMLATMKTRFTEHDW